MHYESFMKKEEDSAINEASTYWTRTFSQLRASPSIIKVWWALPFIHFWESERITGCPGSDKWSWFKDNYVPRTLDRGLVLGCADGLIERQLYQMGFCNYFDSFDITGELLGEARKKGNELAQGHFRYRLADLNKFEFPEQNAYQLVIAHYVFHHIQNLEFLFENIKRALQPGGLILLDEYIGPNRFAMDEKTYRVAKDVYDSLPLRYRRRLPDNRLKRVGKQLLHRLPYSRFKYYAKEFAVADPSEVARTDPSEAVRSEDIVPLIKKNFEVLFSAYWGATIFPTIYALIADNIDISREEDMNILRYIWDKDKEKIEAGEIPSYCVWMVLKNRK